jgi:hypothetical protein
MQPTTKDSKIGGSNASTKDSKESNIVRRLLEISQKESATIDKSLV